MAASPLARRLAQQANINLAQLAGTGPHGRIVKRDIEAALERARRRAESAIARIDHPAASAEQGRRAIQIAGATTASARAPTISCRST